MRRSVKGTSIRTAYYRPMKRFFDLLCSGIGFAILSPLFVVISVFIKLDSPGPVLFKQERIGRGFRPFFIYKFRTMRHTAHRSGLQITAGGDTRITRIGHLLRNTKMDEWPQLINVLRGQMSLVGPRPEVRKYVEWYKDDYKRILSVRPGITDISSITFRDEESMLGGLDDPEHYYVHSLLPEKMRLAEEYIQHASLSYDVKLMLKTLYKVMLPSKESRRKAASFRENVSDRERKGST
jgi:lipopolysaccharide/colanic/teichoic acid biosynthesis glycosyltransferase